MANHSHRVDLRVLALLILAALLVSCTRSISEAPAQPFTPAIITGEAEVDTVKVNVSDSTPPQVNVTVTGQVTDACTTVSKGRQSVFANTISLEIVANRSLNEECAQGKAPFQQTFPVDVIGLPAGEYTINVNGVEAGFEFSGALPTPTLDPGNPLARCPQGTERLAAFVNPAAGLCLLYPAQFQAQTPLAGMTILSAPAPEQGEESGISPSLTIEDAGEVGDVSVEAFANPRLAEYADKGLNLTRSWGQLGGEQSLIVDGLPGRNGVRQAYVVFNGNGYILTLTPVDPALPAISQQAQALWESVNASLTFVDKKAVEAAAAEDCEPNAEFIEDVTIPDGSPAVPGKVFEKTWRVKNSGTCMWGPGYQFVQISPEGNPLQSRPPTTALPATAPGQEAEITVNMFLAPDAQPGSMQTAEFQMRTPKGDLFGVLLYTQVQATDAGEGEATDTGG